MVETKVGELKITWGVPENSRLRNARKQALQCVFDAIAHLNIQTAGTYVRIQEVTIL